MADSKPFWTATIHVKINEDLVRKYHEQTPEDPFGVDDIDVEDAVSDAISDGIRACFGDDAATANSEDHVKYRVADVRKCSGEESVG